MDFLTIFFGKISAINANEIKVVFNAPVLKETAVNLSNYTIKKNGATYSPAGTLTARLLDDNKTVLISDESGSPASQNQMFVNRDTYSVSVANVLNTAYNKVTAYTGSLQVVNDTTAPVLNSVALVGGNVKLYFNEPVSGISVKIDDVAVSAPITYTNAGGDYIAQFAATTAQKSAGIHNITVYNATDRHANILSVANSTYNAATDVTAPSVVSVTPYTAYAFKVQFSEALSAEPTVEVKKGALVLPLDTAYDTNGIKIDATDATGKTYIVQVKDLDANNKVYATGESAVALNVKVKNYTDSANLVGTEYNGAVTLSKETEKPYVVNANLNSASGSVLSVKFNESLSSSYSTDGVFDGAVTVSKNGVTLPIAAAAVATPAADGTTKVANITLTSAVTPGTYTVNFGAGAVKDTSLNANDALTTTVTYTDLTALITPTVTQPDVNVIQVAFSSLVDMSDSAINIANYTMDGVAFPAGTTIGFYGDKKTVRISLPDSYYSVNTTKLLKINKEVVNASGVAVLASVNPAVEFTGNVNLTDNVKPQLNSAKFLVGAMTDTTSNKIKLTFTENMGAVSTSDDFKVTVNGNEVSYTVVDGTTNDKEVTLQLGTSIVMAQPVVVKVVPVDAVENPTVDVKDIALNKLVTGTTITVVDKELDSSAIAQNAVDVATDKAGLSVSYNGTDTTLALPTSGANGTTIAWTEKTDASQVATVSGSTVTIARSNADDIDDTVTFTATITKGTSVDTKDITITVKEAKAPAVTTKLSSAGTFTATGTQTLVFSEDLDAASQQAVKDAVDAAYSAKGTAAVSSAWTSANTLTVTLSGTMDATGSNEVSSTAIAPLNVTDLKGNTTSVNVQ